MVEATIPWLRSSGHEQQRARRSPTGMKRSLIVAFMLTLSASLAESASAAAGAAQGSGTVGGHSDCFTCVPPVISSGGKGVSFSFSFSGTGTGAAVPVTGTFNAVDKETNTGLAYSGPAVIFPQNHTLCLFGVDPCFLTTPDGSTLPAACLFCAIDDSSNVLSVQITFSGAAPNCDNIGIICLS